jgi:hypothetical protein
LKENSKKNVLSNLAKVVSKNLSQKTIFAKKGEEFYATDFNTIILNFIIV